VRTNAAATIRSRGASGSAGSVVASSGADDQSVLLRTIKLLHRILACQRLPHRPERLLIHQPHWTPARGVLRATATVVRLFARTRVSRIAGVQRAVRATDDVDEVHAPIVTGPALPGNPRCKTDRLPGQIAPDGDSTRDDGVNAVPGDLTMAVKGIGFQEAVSLLATFRRDESPATQSLPPL